MKTMKTTVFVLANLVTAAVAELPAKIAGSWVLDAEATTKFFPTSPKWKESDARFLPEIIKSMASMKYSFSEGKMTLERKGKLHSVDATLLEQKGDTFIFELQPSPNYSFKMTCTVNEKGLLNIRSSNTDDLDYYLWKRGDLDTQEKVSDAKLATEVMKKAIKQPIPQK